MCHYFFDIQYIHKFGQFLQSRLRIQIWQDFLDIQCLEFKTKILKKQSPSYQTSQNKLQMTTPRRQKDNFYGLHSLHIYYMIYRALLSMHIKHSIMDILYLWRSFGQLIDVDKVGDRLLRLQCRHLHALWFIGAKFGPKWRKKQKWSQYLYQVTQTLPQICTVILRIRIGMVA